MHLGKLRKCEVLYRKLGRVWSRLIWLAKWQCRVEKERRMQTIKTVISWRSLRVQSTSMRCVMGMVPLNMM